MCEIYKPAYRKKYSEYYGIEFGRDMVVHHIDGDRNNNDIDNLLLLPSTLHTTYHSVVRNIEYDNPCLSFSNVSALHSNLHRVVSMFEEIWPWVRLKSDMDRYVSRHESFPYSKAITANYFRE